LLRVLDHYLHTAHAAARLLSPVPIPLTLGDAEPGAVPETLTDQRQAAEWMEAEEQVLMATVTQADVNGFDVYSDRLGWILMGVSDRRGPNPAAPPDPWGPRRSGVHRGLGTNYSWLIAYPAALTHLEHCAGLYRDLDDSTGVAHTYFGLTSVLEHRGRYQEALEYAQQAAELFSEVAHQHGEARSRNAAGWLLARLGDYDASLTQCQQSLALYRELGDRPMQAVTWDNVGCAHAGLGQYAEAVAAHERALELTRELGDLAEQVVTLSFLGDAHHAAGDTAAAADARRTALTILEGLDPREVAVLREVTNL
jgi:tetratricopeptide (TPR) repeat protein